MYSAIRRIGYFVADGTIYSKRVIMEIRHDLQQTCDNGSQARFTGNV
jgi:hypothetical protein